MNFLKKIFNKKYKIPLIDESGKNTGLFVECIKGDSTYKTLITVYGKIPKQIVTEPVK